MAQLKEAPSAEEYQQSYPGTASKIKKKGSRTIVSGLRSRSPLSFASSHNRDADSTNRVARTVARTPSSRSRSRGRSKSVEASTAISGGSDTGRRSLSRGRQPSAAPPNSRPNSPTRIPSPEPGQRRSRGGGMRRAASPSTPFGQSKQGQMEDSPNSVVPARARERASSPLTMVGGRHVVPKRPSNDIRSPGEANASLGAGEGVQAPIPDFCAQTDANGRAAVPRSVSPGMIVRTSHPGTSQQGSAISQQGQDNTPSSSDEEGADGNRGDPNILETLRMMCCCLLEQDGITSSNPCDGAVSVVDKKIKRKTKKGKVKTGQNGQKCAGTPSSVRTDGTAGASDDEEDSIDAGNISRQIVPQEDDVDIPPGLLPRIRHPDDVGKKCLVLDLDETLVHSSFRAVSGADFVIPVQIEDVVHFVYVAKRPGVDEFLLDMARHYEIVIYTASLNKYADPLLDLLDPHRVIRYRLFRESCVYYEGNYVKDLSVLGRDLRHTIIVDNSPSSYIFHPENAIDCSSFIDCPKDRELDQIGHFCITAKDLPDVRGKCADW
eukprot:CAMPEP_0194349924 /NCGR_PEP_ID=MMETSP0171-20130528/107356_1 /TAXON_ID=218684 /ORGANISM="Corethron pennatum, Strain L29A3" /LENGTH=548 /DNA_ID=CAMNT_0039117427 /DNA_START=504 /DNA_END=2147 /DNA_ORIENTATION=-